MLLPQRYIFSSKSQQLPTLIYLVTRCCCYHKGTYFQANHNIAYNGRRLLTVVVATTKVHIFKQITTADLTCHFNVSCCCYHKGTYFQANHNAEMTPIDISAVVVATTKVHIFKQITTALLHPLSLTKLLLLPQRYIFSSKSQPIAGIPIILTCCCCYHKGTYFQANHNGASSLVCSSSLLLLPQRYIFSSKSQRIINHIKKG